MTAFRNEVPALDASSLAATSPIHPDIATHAVTAATTPPRKLQIPLSERAMWSVREWAAMHGVTIQTVYRWSAKGDIALSKWRGRTFITRESSAAWRARMSVSGGTLAPA